MGWDALSSVGYNYRSKRFKNKEVGELFRNASKEIQENAGYVNWALERGLLDDSHCAYMLEKATGKSCWDENGWSVEQVKEYNQDADWDFEFEPGDAWAYWSARKFLEICAQCNLSIQFSW